MVYAVHGPTYRQFGVVNSTVKRMKGQFVLYLDQESRERPPNIKLLVL